MKIKIFYLLMLWMILFVICTNVLEVNAMNTGFETNNLTSEEKSFFISNIKLSSINSEPAPKTFTCFDVNNKHLIAIGQATMDKKTICVYSNEGIFQYGYTFNCSGSFGVEWDEDNLNIYFFRGSTIVSVTPNGEILDVLECQDTIKNNSYVNHFIHATQRTIDDIEYSIGNNLGILNIIATSFSQITIRDGNGSKSIIYDVSSSQLSSMILTLTIVFAFVAIALVVIFRQFIVPQKNNK